MFVIPVKVVFNHCYILGQEFSSEIRIALPVVPEIVCACSFCRISNQWGSEREYQRCWKYIRLWLEYLMPVREIQVV